MRRRRADGLFHRIATFEALGAGAAALRAVSGKRRSPGPAAFLANVETEVLRLERELQAGTWRPGGYVSFEVREPKRRLISAAPFRDRVVHHAVCVVIARSRRGHTAAAGARERPVPVMPFRFRSRCVRFRRARSCPPSGRTASSSSATRGRRSAVRAPASPRSTGAP